MQRSFRKLLDCRSLLVVFGTQPLAQPLASVTFHRSIGFADWSQAEIVRPPDHHPIEGRNYCLPVQLGFTPAGFLADRFTDALHPLLRGGRAQIGAARFRRVTSTEAIPEKVKLLFRQLTDSRLLFVHRQLQRRHHVPHRGEGFASPIPTTDHEVIGIINDVRSQTLFVSQFLPTEHEPAHVQIAQ